MIFSDRVSLSVSEASAAVISRISQKGGPAAGDRRLRTHKSHLGLAVSLGRFGLARAATRATRAAPRDAG